eukprot:1824575-Lingulodinium_polyedra.AAC.1
MIFAAGSRRPGSNLGTGQQVQMGVMRHAGPRWRVLAGSQRAGARSLGKRRRPGSVGIVPTAELPWSGV